MPEGMSSVGDSREARFRFVRENREKDMTDGELVRQVLEAKGNREEANRGWKELQNRSRPGLERIVSRFIKNPQTAADIISDTYLRALSGLSSFHSGSKFSTWVWRIARNLCTDHFRLARNRHEVLPTYETGEDDPMESVTDTSTMGVSPEETAGLLEMRTAIDAALPLLTSDQREAYILFEEYGLSYDEIARVLGVSPKASANFIVRAREHLKKIISSRDTKFAA